MRISPVWTDSTLRATGPNGVNPYVHGVATDRWSRGVPDLVRDPALAWFSRAGDHRVFFPAEPTMDIATLIRFLGWSLALNFVVLLLWFLVFMLARGMIHRFHGRMLGLSDATVDTMHVAGMAGYKLAIVFFNLVPLLVLMQMR
jgi:hypothetical protein